MNNYNLTHIKELEAESIFVLREVFAQFENPAILFSGGYALGEVPFPIDRAQGP